MHNHIIRFHKKKKVNQTSLGNDKQLLKRLQHMWSIRHRTISPERHHVKRHRNYFNDPTLRSERLKGKFYIFNIFYLIQFFIISKYSLFGNFWLLNYTILNHIQWYIRNYQFEFNLNSTQIQSNIIILYQNYQFEFNLNSTKLRRCYLDNNPKRKSIKSAWY